MDKDDFLVEDLKLKLEYLQGQFSRLWQRLGFFLTVETGIFGFFGWLAFEKVALCRLWIPSVLGVFISLVWYVVAAQDKYLVDEYRERVERAADDLPDNIAPQDYKKSHPGMKAQGGFNNPISWYWSPVSITALPAWIAGLFLFVWVVLLVFAPEFLA